MSNVEELYIFLLQIIYMKQIYPIFYVLNENDFLVTVTL